MSLTWKTLRLNPGPVNLLLFNMFYRSYSYFIKSSKVKTCAFDPLPASVLTKCLLRLLPVITDIVNRSLDEAFIPNSLKTALIIPLLKKTNLDTEDFKNFRPVSNLPFVSKLIEKSVAVQLVQYIDDSLDEKLQSAYKKLHSTETALLKVHDDILRAVDRGCTVVLLLLNLSAAFDTVDHGLLLHRLNTWFGIKGKVLAWFKSYLTDRSQFVSINGSNSSQSDLMFGVPQGSVLGLILYLLYTSPLGDTIRRHDMNFHFYADDCQVYFWLDSVSSVTTTRIEACLQDIATWLSLNKLKLNGDKTDLSVIGSGNLSASQLPSFTAIDGSVIQPSHSARNTGVFFDNKLNMERQVSAICKSAFFHIRNISQIRKFLSVSSAKALVHAFVTCRLDNCNSLLYGLAKHLVHRLQLAQNCAAQLILCGRKHDRVTPLLKELHWLPMDQRIIFKILWRST